MASELNPADIAAWARAKAQAYTQMAEQIEADFKLNGSAGSPSKQAKTVLERMVDLLQDGKPRRAVTVAQDIGVTKRQVVVIVNHKEEFSRNERGWISLNKENLDD